MAKLLVNIGVQNFEKLRECGAFYVDKTGLIQEWWEALDETTLITRPRRFGKTLNMSMLECFFSNKYAGRGDLFEGLSIWEEEKYRKLQGTYPVIFLSFASVKAGEAQAVKGQIKLMLSREFNRNVFLKERLSVPERELYEAVKPEMNDEIAVNGINILSEYMEKYYGRKVIILLDEYDTPMQEAWLSGNWEGTVNFFRSFFNATFKTNEHMARGIITGITHISKESIFSDLNHLAVASVTSKQYGRYFGFMEAEVAAALEKEGFGDRMPGVRRWYDGFRFGDNLEIYNPWSITNFLKSGCVYDTYWADTSSNGLVSSLVQESSAGMKAVVASLLRGESFAAEIEEQIDFSRLGGNEEAVWGLLLAAGYLRVEKMEQVEESGARVYTLKLANYETTLLFKRMVAGWFKPAAGPYNDFVKALLADDVEAMNDFMSEIALRCFSSFDTAKNASVKDDPERFYHGFVLGLMVGLEDRFAITSNRESRFGRYDIMLKPLRYPEDKAYIIEFKVHKPRKEVSLQETAENALAQIRGRNYETVLITEGISPGNIRKYGFAFRGKECLIRKEDWKARPLHQQ